MRTTLSLLACLILAGHVCAEEKPNTLTPKEIEEGWILLFDGETTFGWKIDGESKVADGVLILGGSKETNAVATTAFCNCVIRFDADLDKAKSAELIFNDYTGPFFNAAPPGTKGWCEYHGQILPGDISVWARGSKGFYAGRTGPQTTLGFRVPAGRKLLLRSIGVWPCEPGATGAALIAGPLPPIFNGKDLSGWKEHPDKKSKFSVTPEGWLHMKDGPGDLQTEALYDDFILQLECKTNGKQLNSGVFFRCRPSEYQQGYEAQIHNGFDPDKPKEYIVEEYDPKTYELKDKKKVKSPAIDYGTGGIYRRVPARKQTAKDGEWFTMTVIAQGRHIAIWVNGIQQVDWTDSRPLKDNARNGCRLEKGAISLQGHDPTTDLYFRNIRIVELPKAAEKK
jgi:hypothetical protein